MLRTDACAQQNRYVNNRTLCHGSGDILVTRGRSALTLRDHQTSQRTGMLCLQVAEQDVSRQACDEVCSRYNVVIVNNSKSLTLCMSAPEGIEQDRLLRPFHWLRRHARQGQAFSIRERATRKRRNVSARRAAREEVSWRALLTLSDRVASVHLGEFVWGGARPPKKWYTI